MRSELECSSVSGVFASLARSPGFDPHPCMKIGMVSHACNPSTWEVKNGRSEVQGHLCLHSKL